MEVAKRLIDGANRRNLDLASEPSTPGLEWIPALGAVEERSSGDLRASKRTADACSTVSREPCITDPY